MNSVAVRLLIAAMAVWQVNCYFENCNTGIDRLKQGPADFDYYINNSIRFIDTQFYRDGSLFWNFYTPNSVMRRFIDHMNSHKITFVRLLDLYPDA